MQPTTTPQSGFKSSEFWVTMATAVVTIASLALNLSTQQSAEATAQAGKLAQEAFAFAALAVTAWRYIKSREAQKLAAGEQAAKVEMMRQQAIVQAQVMAQAVSAQQQQPPQQLAHLMGQQQPQAPVGP